MIAVTPDRPSAGPERIERYWRREAEHQARLARHLAGMVVSERNRHRWGWWAAGVAMGALVTLVVYALEGLVKL